MHDVGGQELFELLSVAGEHGVGERGCFELSAPILMPQCTCKAAAAACIRGKWLCGASSV